MYISSFDPLDNYYHLHFADREVRYRKIGNSPEVTQLVSTRAKNLSHYSLYWSSVPNEADSIARDNILFYDDKSRANRCVHDLWNLNGQSHGGPRMHPQTAPQKLHLPLASLWSKLAPLNGLGTAFPQCDSYNISLGRMKRGWWRDGK